MSLMSNTQNFEKSLVVVIKGRIKGDEGHANYLSDDLWEGGFSIFSCHYLYPFDL